MATPRRPYVTIRLGTFDEALAAGVSRTGVLLLARLLTHRDKRSIPGLLRVGLAGLSESLEMSKAEAQRGLAELERAGLLLLDLRERLMYVVGAIDTDGPKTENSVRGMAAQVRELPATSPVTQAVRRAIAAALAAGENEKASAWLATWTDLAGPEPDPESNPEPRPDSGPEPGPHARGRVPIANSQESIAEIRRPRSPAHASLALESGELPPMGGVGAKNGMGPQERFDAFWAAYPRKTAKDAAWRAWQKRKPSSELLEQMMDALGWQVAQDSWLKDGGRFIPHPATWINRGQWQDQPSTSPRLNSRTLAIGRAREEFLR